MIACVAPDGLQSFSEFSPRVRWLGTIGTTSVLDDAWFDATAREGESEAPLKE